MATEAKLERLLNLTAALVDAARPLSAAEIQQRVAGYASSKEAFRRTFERDKDELRGLGVPIEIVPVPGTFPEEQGYWVERDRYEMPDPGLTAEELAALRLALETIGVGDPDETVTGALRRLGGEVDAEDADDGLTAVVADLGVDPNVTPIFAAIAERRVVRFDYRTPSEVTSRTIEPWSLGFRRGHWYVEGHDTDREAPRQFRLDRVVGPVATGDPGAFDPPADTRPPSDRAPWRYGGDDPIEAVVRISPRRIEFARVALGPAASMEIDDDGWARFTFTITNVAALRSFVLGLLDDAEIAGPDLLRSDMIDWLRSMVEAGR